MISNRKLKPGRAVVIYPDGSSHRKYHLDNVVMVDYRDGLLIVSQQNPRSPKRTYCYNYINVRAIDALVWKEKES